MKPGTIVRLEDGREATVVYHGLDGYGVQFGRKEVDLDIIKRGNGNLIGPPLDGAEKWFPEMILKSGEYEIVED